MSLGRFWSVEHTSKWKPSVDVDNPVKEAKLLFPDIEPPSFSLGLEDLEQPLADTLVKDSESSSDEEEHFNFRIYRRRHATLNPLECKKDKGFSGWSGQNVGNESIEDTRPLPSTQLTSKNCLKRLHRGASAECSQPLKYANDMFEETETTPVSKQSECLVTVALVTPTIYPVATNLAQCFVGTENKIQRQCGTRICISDDDIEECSSEDEAFYEALQMPGVRSMPSLRPLRKPHTYEHLQSFSDTRRRFETSSLPDSASLMRPVVIQKTSMGSKEVKFENSSGYASCGWLKEEEHDSSWNKNLFDSFAAEMDDIEELEKENDEAFGSKTSMLGDRMELQDNLDLQFLHETTSAMHSKGLQGLSEANVLVTEERRIAALLQKRLPHFTPVDALPFSEEPIFIKYREQFGSHPNTNLTPMQSIQLEQGHNLPRKRPRNNHGGKFQVKRKSATENREVRRKRGVRSQDFLSSHTQPTKPAGSANGYMTVDTAQASKKGYWLTERSGSRTYVTQDGVRLSGSMAYKQYLKENGRSRKVKAHKQK